MQLSDRFIDYATTGAFFVVSQLIFIASWTSKGLLVLFFWLSGPTAPTVPSWLQTPADGLLAALGISSIFFFGLVLDLLGSILRSGELRRFHQHLLQNHDWLIRFAKRDAFVAGGLVDFLQLDVKGTSGEEDFMPLLKKWDKSSPWRTYKWDILKDVFPFVNPSDTYARYKNGYARLRYYLNSFISFNNSGAVLDAVSDQTHLWRTGRAIFVATLALTVECLLALLATFSALFFHWPSIPFAPVNGVVPYFITLIVLFTATYIAARMALEPYSRMYANTLALAYLTYKKLYESASPAGSMTGLYVPAGTHTTRKGELSSYDTST